MLTIDKPVTRVQEAQRMPANGTTQDASFADLLDEYQPETLKKGQYVTGEILQLEDNVILADVDAKRTAVIPPQDMERIEEEELAQLSVGDEVTLYVLRTPLGDEDLLVSLNKGLEQQDWLEAKAHLDNDELLELEVIGHNKGGLMVAFGRLRGFVPTSHVPQLRHAGDHKTMTARKAELVGEELPLKVIEVDRDRGRFVLSVKKAQKELRQKRFLELKEFEGKRVTGRVTNLVKFGAFVDLGGVEGLIHISEIDWQRVERAADFLSPGEEVEVLIQSVDVDRERIQLSRKELLPSPWEAFAEEYTIGDLVEGEVTSVVDFGAFVLVADAVEGLVHVSEMRGTNDFAPQDVLLPGDTILVRILNIEPEQQRLSLSQRRISSSEESEWIWQQQEQETPTPEIADSDEVVEPLI